MDGTSFALNSDGFSDSAKRADTPLRLALPVPMRTMRFVPLVFPNIIQRFLIIILTAADDCIHPA